MPNWCMNGITLRHADPAMIDRVIKGKDSLLMEFIPTPTPLVETTAGSFGECEREDDNTVRASFDSAWAPPVDAYIKLLALGFEIEAFYYEPGMGFVGKFTGDAEDYNDEYYEYSGETSETVREAIGPELDDYFGISEEMAQWEEENEED